MKKMIAITIMMMIAMMGLVTSEAKEVKVNIPCELLEGYTIVCKPDSTNYMGSIQYEDGTPFVGKIKVAYNDDWINENETDSIGNFSIPVEKNKEFMFSAKNKETWLTYVNKIKSVDGQWSEFDTTVKDWVIHNLRVNNLILTSSFKKDINTDGFENISKTEFKLFTISFRGEQGAYIEVDTIKDRTYKLTINTSKKVNIYISDSETDILLRSVAKITGTNTDLTLAPFEAMGSSIKLYFAPEEIGELKIKNISLNVK